MTAANPLSPLAAALARRYRIDREIGRGRMATVYLAHDLRHGRRVAVKVLRPDLAASVGRERFLRERRSSDLLCPPPAPSRAIQVASPGSDSQSPL